VVASPAQTRPRADWRWLLALTGLVLVFLGHPWLWLGGRQELLFAPVGIGLALTGWLGFRVTLVVLVELLVLQLVLRPNGVTLVQAAVDAMLAGGEIALAWWCYRNRAGGARRLTDPNSATLFLVLVPGAIVLGFATLRMLNRHGIPAWGDFGLLLRDAWLNDALSILTIATPLLAVLTPWLVHYHLADADPSEQRFTVHPRLTWTFGEVLETVGLAIGAGILGLALTALHLRETTVNWQLWGVLLLVIVWASLRLGLRGGTLVAATATLLAVLLGTLVAPAAALDPLRGHLVALGCTALLIGSSADWIRASEARYRQVVGHIPVVLYSARFLRKPAHGTRPEVEVLLVSPAARDVFGCEPEALLGNYDAWLQRIHEADRELVQAALAQLLLQNQPLTCEYRLAADTKPRENGAIEREGSNPLLYLSRAADQRYVRDTLAPHYGADGQLDGWEGVVEDITQQRQLAHDLRRTTNMLHAVVAHLPTGVFFVHGLNGQPLLVNARARQLLGQREDLAAGLTHLAAVYRLHRNDGRPYPWQELPVARALREGATCMCDDIVVHRPDGRRVPLVTWAAPVDLGNQGATDAAVWVLEDLTALRQAESARQETELRLRIIIETMAEGLVVQDPSGLIVECNPAACAILGADVDQLRTWFSLAPERGCFREDGTPLPREDEPDRVSLRTGKPVRGAVVGIATADGVRWILANSMPLSLADKPGDKRGQRVVTTLSDITAYRRAQQEMQQVQRLELVGKIASGVVHDFNNLLTVICGYADLLQAALGQHPARDDVQQILRAADQARRLARQMLTFSKQRQVVKRPVDLHTVTAQTVNMLVPTLPDSIEVELRGPAGPLIVLADESPVQQVVMNLCLNARDAMPRGGRLVVETAAENHGGRLSVSDTGTGMSAEIQARVFEPLFTTKENGSGLGLAVVKQIAEGFGGSVRVTSVEGKGSRFDVWLPAPEKS
jgi:signal transduction histidine kinase